MVEGTHKQANLGTVRLDCSTSLDAAKLQLLASLSTCMLCFLEQGAQGLTPPVQGASAASSSVAMPTLLKVGEVQFAYDSRGLYGATNDGGITTGQFQAMLSAVIASDYSSEDEESPLLRAIFRLKQILNIVPSKKPLASKIQIFNMGADDSTWMNNVVKNPLSEINEDNVLGRVELAGFLTEIRSGSGLNAALDYEARTDWPGGTCVLHAELRVLNAGSEFWWWALFTFLTSAALSVVSDKLSAVFSIATLLPAIAVGARRLHDTDRSGWWQFLWFVPVIGWIVLIVWWIQEGKASARFDRPS